MARIVPTDEVVKKAVEQALTNIEYKGKTIREWVELIKSGVLVEVVRCEECKHWIQTGNTRHGRCNYEHDKPLRWKHEFCSYGERREGE